MTTNNPSQTVDFSSLPSQYDHTAAQEKWYPFWESKGYFRANTDPEDRREPFSIVIPPPNVTGALHLGHALNNTLQDILVRMKRMQDYNVLWMPGTDHAGIATQAVVERRLLEEEKLSRHDLGRERLTKRIWKWKEQYESRILGQLKQMGFSCDWQRLRFTLDPVCARAVRETFFKLFQDEKIYRGKRLVNWDTFLQTAVSDDEVFHDPVQGHFWHIRYPVIDPKPGEPAHVTIATTRPETMLGDTAVAVHPDPAGQLDRVEAELREKLTAAPDNQRETIQSQIEEIAARRNSKLAELITLREMAGDGRMLQLPLTDRQIPLIVDIWAKPELGSGCVKITPAHDANDYEVWQRSISDEGPEIGAINILLPDGTLNDHVPERYRGLTVKEARKQTVAELESEGLLVEIEDREIDLAHSDRSKTPIEPYLADQWFVKMDKLAQTAIDAVRDGRVKITPSRYAKGYLDWLGEKRDWPIGRQLWWGHQIPIWSTATANAEDLEEAFAGRSDVVWHRDQEKGLWLVCVRQEDLAEDAIPGHTLTRETDVLDTWFSSALWPFSTLGWPDKKPELDRFYPTSTLVTSRDIITLWVARMVLSGLYNMGEVPFGTVYIHPKILDGYGETMSKSKGNGVDPLDVIDKFGADSLRFGIAHLTTETQDVRMPVEFECPHCGGLMKQTKKNRTLPRVDCAKCGQPFSTQWAESDQDKALPRGAAVSEQFELGRNFCNKLWNASRFALMNFQVSVSGEGELAAIADGDLKLEDRWLLSRLATVTDEVTNALEHFRYADAARTLYGFAWDEFCSFYIEMTKTRFAESDQRLAAGRVLAHALDVLLRLLHPMIPFLTEEVWQLLAAVAPVRGLADPKTGAESICIAPWPEAHPGHRSPDIERQFRQFQAVLGAIREVRTKQNVPLKESISFAVRCDGETARLLEPMRATFARMVRATATGWGPEVVAGDQVASVILPGAHFSCDGLSGNGDPIEVHVDISACIDVEAERARLEKKRDEFTRHITTIEKKLANGNFVRRAPAPVVGQQRDKLVEVQGQLASVEGALAKLGS